MKKITLIFALILCFAFYLFGCSCNKEETVSKEDAIEVLKESLVKDNVEITTTTETVLNGIKTISVQEDVYYENKYYHLSETSSASTKTWYGEINNVLYAFYYTKNANNEEIKTSSRIDNEQMQSIKQQPNMIINSIINNDGYLSDKFEVEAKKTGRTYTIQITGLLENESSSYTFTIIDSMIIKIVQSSNINNDTITITYDYNYDVRDIELPSLSEYPLNVNN